MHSRFANLRTYSKVAQGVLSVGLCLIASEAHAQTAWKTVAGEDALSDQKTAVASAADSSTILSFKCWQGEPKETLLLIITTSPFTTEAISSVTLRIDKNPAKEIAVKGKDFNGRQGYVVAAQFDDDVLMLTNEANSARERFVVAVNGSIRTLTATGASAAFGKFATICK